MAIFYFAEAVRLSPANGPAQLRLGELLVEEEQASKALPHLEAALQEMPRSAEAHLALYHAFVALARPEEAAAHLRRAVSLQSNSQESPPPLASEQP